MMKKNMLSSLMKMVWASCMAMMPATMMAQQLSVEGGRGAFAPGESVAIEYSGTQAGDRILLYHNVAMLPLKALRSK